MKRTIRIAALCATVSALFWMVTGMAWWLGCPEDNLYCGREFAIILTHVGLMVAGAVSYVE